MTLAASAPPEARESVPRTVKGLSLVSLFNDLASEMVYPLLPAFVTRTLGGGALLLGLLDGASDLTSSALKLASGRLADRPRWRSPLILVGYATAILVRPIIAVANAAWQVVGFRVVDRVGKGIRTAPRDALIAAVTPASQRGRAFGFHRGADHLGAVVGSLLAWYLLSRGAEVRSVIGWSAAPGIVAFLVLAVVLRGAGGDTADRRAENRGDGSGEGGPPRSASSSAFLPPILTLAALSFFRLPETLLLLRLQDRGVAVTLIPLIWAGLHVVRSASSYPGGWLSDRIGPRRLVTAGGVLFAGVALGLAAQLTPATAVAAFLFFGVVAGLTESSERLLVARLSPATLGRGFGVYHALVGLAALPAGLLFGAVYQTAGGPRALVISAGGTALAVVAWMVISLRSRETSTR
ncbi:MAG TPA: MFS transporter [Gemmatimonadales bacterium]